MTDLKALINLNIELEGLLKVLADRDSQEARSLLSEKFHTYSDMLGRYLDEDHATELAEEENDDEPRPHSLSESENQPEAAQEFAQDAECDQVKDQEAEEPEIPDEATDAAEAVEAEELHDDAELAPHPAMDLRKAFTLNDKFRFIRDIFNGNEQDFNDTLAVLSEMDSYKEAAGYITGDLMLDPDNADVADFLDIIARNF